MVEQSDTTAIPLDKPLFTSEKHSIVDHTHVPQPIPNLFFSPNDATYHRMESFPQLYRCLRCGLILSSHDIAASSLEQTLRRKPLTISTAGKPSGLKSIKTPCKTPIKAMGLCPSTPSKDMKRSTATPTKIQGIKF